MDNSVFTLLAKLTLDDDEFKDGLSNSERTASSAGERIGSIMGTIGRAVGTAVIAGATAVGALVNRSVQAYAEFEQLQGGMEKLFGDSADTIMEYAQQGYLTAGVSANEYMQQVTSFSASLISSLGGDTETAVEYADRAVRAMSDNANTFGTSLESIQNAYQGFAKENYTMLDNLSLGYGGTREEMARLIQDASQMTDVMEELGVTVDADSMSFDNIVNAIAVVQANMNIAGTTINEALGTISGSTTALKSAWENLLTGMADDNSDFGALIDNVVTTATAVWDNIEPRVEIALSGVADLIDGLLPKIVDKVPAMIEAVLPKLLQTGIKLIDSVIKGISTALPALVSSAVMIIGELVNSLTEALPMVLEAGIEAIVTLAEGISSALPTLIPTVVSCVMELANTLVYNLPLLLDAVLSIVEGLAYGIIDSLPIFLANIGKIITGINSFISKSFPMILEAIGLIMIELEKQFPYIIAEICKLIPELMVGLTTTTLEMMPELIDCFISLFNAFQEAMPYILQAIKESAKTILPAIGQTLMNGYGTLFQIGKDMLSKIKDGFVGNNGVLVQGVRTIWTNFKNAIETAFSGIKNIGSNLITGLWNGISDKVSWITNKIKGFGTSVMNAIKGIFGIHSPSKEMAWIGKMLDEGLISGISSLSDDVIDEASSLSDDVLGAFNGDVQMTAPTAQISANNSVAELLAEYLPQLANMQIVMDTRTIVGQLASPMDEALGRRMALAERGV